MQLPPPLELPPGPFTSAQAAALGISERRLRDAVRNGQVRRPFRDAYIDAQLELTEQRRAETLLLVVPDHGIVCDRSAAWLHGIDVFGYGDKDLIMPVELCSLRGNNPTRRQHVDGRTRDLLPEDVMEIGGVRVTTPLRTALDLGCALPRLRAIAALDAFRREHQVSLAELQMGVLRFRRRRGVVQLRRLVPLTDPLAESHRESATRLLILDAGMPAPVAQWWIEVDGLLMFRLDLAYPRLRVAIEYDGREFHFRTEAQRRHDRDRRAWLRAHGWTVIVVDSDSLFLRDGTGWLEELRAALQPRTKRLRWARVPN